MESPIQDYNQSIRQDQTGYEDTIQTLQKAPDFIEIARTNGNTFKLKSTFHLAPY